MTRLAGETAWAAPHRHPLLEPGEIHVWRAFLDDGPLTQDCLSPDERERASRFVFERDRRRFLAARSILRELLAPYLETSPRALRFDYGPHGKPFLSFADVHFNVSHSDGRALVGVARGREVGIDLERIQDSRADWRAISRYFSPGEQAAIEALPQEDRVDAFFRQWVRKEAYIKARGGSVLSGLAVATDDPNWLVQDLSPFSGFAAAVCAEGAEWSLKCLTRHSHGSALPAFGHAGCEND